MPGNKKSTKNTTEEVKQSTPVVEESATPAPAKKSSRKKAEAVQQETVQEPVAETTQAQTTVQEGETTKRRKVVNREHVEALFDSLDAELTSLAADIAEGKKVSSKKIRSLQKMSKTLRNDSLKLSKQKVKGTRANSGKSGFMKPVRISKELAKFTKWNPEEPRSRVDVTKFLCTYVKEHNLQNPSDKRQINPDAKLTSILQYEPSQGALTYPGMQKRIQHHFSNL